MQIALWRDDCKQILQTSGSAGSPSTSPYNNFLAASFHLNLPHLYSVTLYSIISKQKTPDNFLTAYFHLDLHPLYCIEKYHRISRCLLNTSNIPEMHWRRLAKRLFSICFFFFENTQKKCTLCLYMKLVGHPEEMHTEEIHIVCRWRWLVTLAVPH